MSKQINHGGTFLIRVDAQLNTFGAYYYNYYCKLQALLFPIIGNTPYSDLPGTAREVSWRSGKDSTGTYFGATGVSISMQAPLTVPSGFGSGASVRMVCWGNAESGAPFFDYGIGVNSAVLSALSTSFE